jgi:hypothetical protein
VPSLDGATDTTRRFVHYHERLDTGQCAPRRMARAGNRRKDLGTRDRFSRRLQLGPGLVPPSSWSLPPCNGPEIHWRAKLLKSPGPGGIYLILVRSAATLRPTAWCSSHGIASVFESTMEVEDDYAEADRREVNPPIEVESATWSPGGTLDWWVKERQESLGRVRGPDGRQRWVTAADLRPAEDRGSH